jgi:hypothetical protein
MHRSTSGLSINSIAGSRPRVAKIARVSVSQVLASPLPRL